MWVKKGDIVKAFIRGETGNGEVFFSNKNKHPVEFRVNSHFFLKEIEHVVVGMKKGETKETTLSPDESYGYRKEELIKTLPRGYHTEKKKKGDRLTYFDFKQKKAIEGIVIESQPKTLVVDFNHSLCGQSVKYNVEVLDIVKKNQYIYYSDNQADT